MIPILQFDPSSLSFWYDTHIIGRSRGSDAVGRALDLALRGRDAELQTHVAGIADPWTKTRAANVASATWHEKRHFLDFVLTNYGAFRMRQFMMIYVNLGAMGAEAQKVGHIVAPIQSWLSPHTRAVLGIGEPSDTMAALCRDVLNRKRILTEDRMPIDSRFGGMEIGGEGQLEAIAHLVQYGKAHRVFGHEMSIAVQSDVAAHDINYSRYAWAYKLFTTAGLIDPPTFRQRDERTELWIDDAPIIPLCYAALACRLYGQEQAASPSVSSYLPKMRLASLAIAMRGAPGRFKGLSAIDCWDSLQGTCREVFGRTIVEEMQADFEQEERLLEQLRAKQTMPIVLDAYEDFHALRGRLMAILRDSPALIVDQAAWSDTMVARTQPMLVVAATAGELGEPPPDYDKVLAYSDPYVEEDAPEKQWWWAASPRFWPETTNPDALCLKARAAWLEIASSLAPAAKLLIDGRRGRTMLGPELIRAEAFLKDGLGLEVLVDPRFAYPPRAEISTTYWRWMTGSDAFRCDLSFETVQSPEGKILSPWALRLKAGLVNALLGNLEDDYGRHLRFWRDWSPYLLNEEFRQIVEDFDDDPTPFISKIGEA